MKRLLLAPLLLTLLVGCSSKDKTFYERKDECANWSGNVISNKDFFKKYKLNPVEGLWDEDLIVRFCEFYK